ncbi:dynein axonemal intermediate chain 7 [Gouania willdenowi]|uniref:Dynein axonemal intermediate chain 7 n=1 Tax=Gouania willdenowi TaxID=441366 RepID=A0A8C5DWG7_GOUWI|nr:protein CASC1 [Gouania willdenowi]
MEPKNKKSLKKGSKTTKAQKIKQQQEDEEQRLREEEEARLQDEREQQQRLERERKEKEIERLELKDQERREAELNELHYLLEENHAAVTRWKSEAVEKAKWERYLRCDGCPDPAVQKDINTYISLWRDDHEVNLTSVLDQLKLSLQLMEELEDHLSEAADQQVNHNQQETILNLQELIHTKHLLITEDILKRASMNIDTETGNMQTVIRHDKLTLCLWANLKKNPRFQSLNFEEVGLGLEIPKQLVVSDIAVWILHTRYDHLSLLARMTHLTTHTPSHRSGFRSFSGNEEVQEEIEISDKDKTNDDEEEVKQCNNAEQHRMGSDLSVLQSAAIGQAEKSSPKPAEGQSSQIETQMEHLAAEGGLISPPARLTVKKNDLQVVDLRQYTPLGGVFYYDVFHLPPQAHQVNGWEIRQLMDTGLQVFPYLAEKPSLEGDDVMFQPVEVSVTRPDSVVFLETPQVACWDAAVKQWMFDGIMDVSYKENEAKISFKMDSFQAFTLMQETYINFPFKSWELRPLGQDCANFTINGALKDLSITIKGSQCMLLQAEPEENLSHIVGQWMSFSALQRAMINTGINVFVNQHTDTFVSTCGKDALTEHAVYEQMALFASACAFSWSEWNARCGAEHLVLKACEHSDSTPVPKHSWSLYLLGAQRSQMLQNLENSEAFSADHLHGSEFHSTFIHMLQDNMSPDGIARTRQSHYLFVDTIQSLLCATRPLMYS